MRHSEALKAILASDPLRRACWRCCSSAICPMAGSRQDLFATLCGMHSTACRHNRRKAMSTLSGLTGQRPAPPVMGILPNGFSTGPRIYACRSRNRRGCMTGMVICPIHRWVMPCAIGLKPRLLWRCDWACMRSWRSMRRSVWTTCFRCAFVQALRFGTRSAICSMPGLRASDGWSAIRACAATDNPGGSDQNGSQLCFLRNFI